MSNRLASRWARVLIVALRPCVVALGGRSSALGVPGSARGRECPPLAMGPTLDLTRRPLADLGRRYPDAIAVSARTGERIRDLVVRITALVPPDRRHSRGVRACERGPRARSQRGQGHERGAPPGLTYLLANLDRATDAALKAYVEASGRADDEGRKG